MELATQGKTKPYCIEVKMSGNFAEAVQKVKEAMKAEGFGTLSEIDVKATLKEKIDADVAPYTILGVCNPQLAHRAIGIEPKIGVFLPCTVLVRDNGKEIDISAQDPVLMEEIIGNPELQPIAREARSRIEKVLRGLQS